MTQENLPAVVAQPTVEGMEAYSLRQCFDAFLRLTVADGQASPKTISAYREGFKAFLSWCFVYSLNPVEAEREHIQEYRAYLTAKYHRRTTKIRLTAVRALYKALVSTGRRKDNPAEGIRSPRLANDSVSAIMRKALSPAECKTFLSRLDMEVAIPPLRDRAIILLMMLQGLRACEISAATIGDIETADHHDGVMIRRPSSTMFVRGKGGKDRTILLCEKAQQAVHAWRQLLRTNDPIHANDPLFPSATDANESLSVRAIERIVDNRLQAAGLKIPGRSAHALRHTFAVLAVMGGAEREALAQTLGHSSSATTDLYTRAACQFQRNPAVAALEAIQNQP